MKILHQEHDINDIVRFFTDAFNLPDGTRVADGFNYDPRTGKVIFTFYQNEPTEQTMHDLLVKPHLK